MLATGCMIQNDLAPSHSSARGVLSLCRKMGLLPDMPIEFFCRGAPLESSSTLDLIARTVSNATPHCRHLLAWMLNIHDLQLWPSWAGVEGPGQRSSAALSRSLISGFEPWSGTPHVRQRSAQPIFQQSGQLYDVCQFLRCAGRGVDGQGFQGPRPCCSAAGC